MAQHPVGIFVRACVVVIVIGGILLLYCYGMERCDTSDTEVDTYTVLAKKRGSHNILQLPYIRLYQDPQTLQIVSNHWRWRYPQMPHVYHPLRRSWSTLLLDLPHVSRLLHCQRRRGWDHFRPDRKVRQT